MRLSALGGLLAPRRPRVAGANSSSWSTPPLDPVLGVPVPFACAYDDGRASLALLNKARVTQCALSRVCGVCGGGLERPVAFVGTVVERGRHGFHFPPVHAGCAASLVALVRQHGVPLPGQEAVSDELVVVTGPGFEFVRPTAAHPDPRPVFAPHADPAEVNGPER
ncbi:MAG: hypothetical protein QOH37_3983 [Nocardioidaceae bacterium]|nr:hypothetical protein [Nocardioidaceae bacterium]